MTSSSWGRLNFLSRLRKNKLCCAFFLMESMWAVHFKSREMVDPRNRKVSTVDTVLLSMIYR